MKTKIITRKSGSGDGELVDGSAIILFLAQETGLYRISGFIKTSEVRDNITKIKLQWIDDSAITHELIDEDTELATLGESDLYNSGTKVIEITENTIVKAGIIVTGTPSEIDYSIQIVVEKL